MHKKYNVTIGIPVYNEGNNIARLLRSLLAQKTNRYILSQIIVVSDMSSDNTDSEILAIKDRRIKLIRNSKRLGPALGQNIIIKRSSGDFIVILNGDVVIKDPNLIDKLIEPMIKDPRVGLICPRFEPLKATTNFESIINSSVRFTNNLFHSWNKGVNMYTCKGRCRVLSKELAKSLVWPKIIAEDAYTYFWAKKMNFKYLYLKDLVVFYRSPTNFRDHQAQNRRFSFNKNELKKYFDEHLINTEYKIPSDLFLKSLFQYILSTPIKAVFYLIINYLITKLPYSNPGAAWNTIPSTKKI